MGAFTSNRNKRYASSQSSRSRSDYNHLHNAKKLKSSPYIGPKKTSTSSISKLNPFRFVSGFTAKLKRLFINSRRIIAQKAVFLGDMGNALSTKYNYAKESAAGYIGVSLHDISLRRLRFDIKSLEEKRAVAKKKENVANDPFRPLTEEEEEMVNNALSFSNLNKVLVTHENSHITITGEVLQCLKPNNWLNDEVINVYLELLKEREIRDPQKYLKCHFFSTFFYTKLISEKKGYDYESVRRWTAHKKLGYSLLECDKIFVPIHQQGHWCLAVINKKEKKIQYLDSFGGTDHKVLRVLVKYITDEVNDKTGQNIDVSLWEQEFVTDLPRQENCDDCGMFMIKYADYYSRDIGLCFNQEHMPYFRLRTAKEILELRAN